MTNHKPMPGRRVLRRLLADRGWATTKRYRSGQQMDAERRKYKKIERAKAQEELAEAQESAVHKHRCTNQQCMHTDTWYECSGDDCVHKIYHACPDCLDEFFGALEENIDTRLETLRTQDQED